MIRFAVDADLDELVAFCSKAYYSMDYDSTGYKFQPERVTHCVRGYITSPDYNILLYMENCKIMGVFIFTIIDHHHYFADKKYTTELVWHTDPEMSVYKQLRVMVKLFEAMEMYSKAQGSLDIYCGLDARPDYAHDGITRYLTKKGYGHTVKFYHKGVNHV